MPMYVDFMGRILTARPVGNYGLMGQMLSIGWDEVRPVAWLRPPEPISNFIYMEKGWEIW